MSQIRKTPSPLEMGKQGMASPTSSDSSPYGRTPSHRTWTSSTPHHNPPFRIENRCSPTVVSNRLFQQYVPPPPITGHVVKPSVFEHESMTDFCSPGSNLNHAIPCSISPLAEERYACEGTRRPVSAAGTQRRVESASPLSQPRRPSSSTIMAPPRPRVVYSSNCGALIEEKDPVTGDIISRYRCGLLLGTGGFAQVFEFTDLSNGFRYAGKVIDKRNLTRRGSEAKIRMEIDLHGRMRHSNILRFEKAFQDEFYHYILLEQCSRKSLMDLSKERCVFTCEEMQHILIQITQAVEYMHNNLIIHRDLKLGNVMIDFDGNMKVGDFGFASELMSPSDRKRTTCGTPNYIAPEVLSSEKSGIGYGLEADIWSLGVLLYALAFGTPPFETKDIATTYEKIRRVDYFFPSGTTVSESCKDLIRWMLQKEPNRRPTAEQILRHSFLCLPHPPHTIPKTLIPLDGTKSPSNERRSPLWASPIGVYSPLSGNHLHHEKEGSKNVVQKGNNGKVDEVKIRKVTNILLRDKDSLGGILPGPLFTSSRDVLTQMKPKSPALILQGGIYCNKYGHGFLAFRNGKKIPTVFLNDKTKLVYDIDSDTVYYYGRYRMQVPQETGCRSPLLSEELTTKGFRDDLTVFHHASVYLAHHRNEGKDNLGPVESAAAKKLAIAKFFLPFLERGTRDKRMVTMTCVFKEWLSSWDKELFETPIMEDERMDTVYVKDAVIESLFEITGEYQDADMRLMAARMSDYSFQVSVRCNGCTHSSLFLPKCDGLDTQGCDGSWGMDIIVYSGFRAVVALEIDKYIIVLSFEDLNCYSKTVAEGKVYFAAESTVAQSKSISIPSAMLRAITIILRKVRCNADVIDCFC